jgi:hypothetical protein
VSDQDNNHPQDRWGSMQQPQYNPYMSPAPLPQQDSPTGMPVDPSQGEPPVQQSYNAPNATQYENQPYQTYSPTQAPSQQNPVGDPYNNQFPQQGMPLPVSANNNYGAYQPMPMPYPMVNNDPGKGLAVTSLILGLVSLALGPLTAIPAIIFGHIALAKKTKSKGLALTGLILGYVITAIIVLVYGLAFLFYMIRIN